jgi:hypothetical protein
MSIKDYRLEDAYDIRGAGVGKLNLEKAAKSPAFIKKASELAKKIDKVKLFVGK